VPQSQTPDIMANAANIGFETVFFMTIFHCYS
jgi:hypothetical protein